MAIMFVSMLLAALCTFVMAGPVRNIGRERIGFSTYTNTSSFVPSTTQTDQTPPSDSFHFSTVSVNRSVGANTALVVEPIQQTVFTHIIPAITYLNPEGKPLATENARTILSTSYITPKPTPIIPVVSSITLELSAVTSPELTPFESVMIPLSSSRISTALTSSIAVVENGTASVTSRMVPVFTYSPIEKETGALPIPPVNNSLMSTSRRLPGFDHPNSASRTLIATSTAADTTITGDLSYSLSTIQATPPTVSSLSSSVLNGSLATYLYPTLTSQSLSNILVTKTEYTTVFGAPPPSEATSFVPQAPSLESAGLIETQNTPSAQQTSPLGAESPATSVNVQSSVAKPLSPADVPLPTASLSAPPLVIITQYTTVTPTPQPTNLPNQSNLGPEPEPSPSAPMGSSTHADSSIPAAAGPTEASSSIPTTSAPMSSASAPPLGPSTSASATTTGAEVVPSDISSAPSRAPVPIPSSTFEGPLIITPIPSSQIFTVTVTVTEKETVKETTTVTMTA